MLRFICVTWRRHVCDVTHSYDMYRRWRRKKEHDVEIHICDMTHSYAWHAAFICVTWLIHMTCAGGVGGNGGWRWNSYLWHDAFICVTCCIHMCDVTHSYDMCRLQRRKRRMALRMLRRSQAVCDKFALL